VDIYLDIDGVLLSDSPHDHGNPTAHSLELLKFLTDNYKVFWLTSNCYQGENHITEVLYPKYPEEARVYIDKIIPTNWNRWKTEAIDFSQDFRWLDDDVYDTELAVLAKNNCSDKLVKIDLINNPEQLRDVIAFLETL